MSEGGAIEVEAISLAIIIPTLNAADGLRDTLHALSVPTPGMRVDVIVVDGGSTDETLDIAQRFGARIAVADGGRGPQLAEGARHGFGDWLFFLHADTQPPPDWPAQILAFTKLDGAVDKAAYFQLRLDDSAPAARRVERFVAWRARVLGLAYGDQGLVLSRRLYERVGGYPHVALMEDVALIRRIAQASGRKNLVALGGYARTSAARYRKSGYSRRGARNLVCLGLYFLGVPPRVIARLYRG